MDLDIDFEKSWINVYILVFILFISGKGWIEIGDYVLDAYFDQMGFSFGAGHHYPFVSILYQYTSFDMSSPITASRCLSRRC